MSERSRALWRIWAFIWLLIAGSIIISIVVVFGFLWGLVDLLWSLASGRNDLPEESRPAQIVKETLQWEVDLTVYTLTANREFRWLPNW